jgi:hypothetical protein
MAGSLPYMNAHGNITKALKKIQSAATPPRFTQDFLATKLNLKGGSPKPLIPFLKKTGFIGGDGVPTDLYKRFWNPTERGRAAREALRKGFGPLYDVNEYIHDSSDKELIGIIVQVTGGEPDSRTTKAIMASFKALKEFATFDTNDEEGKEEHKDETVIQETSTPGTTTVLKKGLGLSYTINLNLPATSDIAVFDAKFKSLRDHLLK